MVSFSRMRIVCELDEIATFVWRQASSRSRSTISARLEAFITTTALEMQFCELGNPPGRSIEF